MIFCKECGTFYNEKQSECPKCATADLVMESVLMGEGELKRERRKSWVQILIGIPLLIGFIYLIIYLIQVL